MSTGPSLHWIGLGSIPYSKLWMEVPSKPLPPAQIACCYLRLRLRHRTTLPVAMGVNLTPMGNALKFRKPTIANGSSSTRRLIFPNSELGHMSCRSGLDLGHCIAKYCAGLTCSLLLSARVPAK